MAERPNKNWEPRNFESRGPNESTDIYNPTMGKGGPDAYKHFVSTEDGDKYVSALSQTGTFRIHNKKMIEIVAGEPTNDNTAILISGLKGNMEILIEDGQVKIKGNNIIMDSDTDITLNAGRNITLNAKSGIFLKSITVNASGMLGNLVSSIKKTFMQQVFAPTKVGLDYLENPPFGDKFLKNGITGGVELGSFMEETMGNVAPQLESMAGDLSGQLGDIAGDLGGQLGDITGDLSGQLGDITGDLSGQLGDIGGDLGGQLGDLKSKIKPSDIRDLFK